MGGSKIKFILQSTFASIFRVTICPFQLYLPSQKIKIEILFIAEIYWRKINERNRRNQVG